MSGLGASSGLAIDGTGPAVCGHRGAPVAEPENTLVGFKAAFERGATWVEFDIRPTKDRQLVLHHDPVDLDGRRIAELERRDIDPAAPTLAEVCSEFGTRLNFDIELKADDIGMGRADFARLVAAELAGLKDVLPARWMVTSFHAELLDDFRSQDRDAAIGLLFEEDVAPRAIGRAERCGFQAILPWHDLVDGDLVDQAHRLGLAVGTWTVNEPDDVARVAAAGVDMIIGDDPAVIAAQL